MAAGKTNNIELDPKREIGRKTKREKEERKILNSIMEKYF
jgi:hypothetical protein